jgi:2-keto-4-pentenoate hydratase
MASGNPGALAELQAIAAEAFAALETGHQISPFSARISAFDLDDAYRMTAAIRQMRERRGEMPVGRKIGFTGALQSFAIAYAIQFSSRENG